MLTPERVDRDPVPARRRHPDAARRVHRRCRPSARRRERAMELSLRWAERCARRVRRAGRQPGQALFGIVQGGTDAGAAARARPRRWWRMDFPGYARRRPRRRRGPGGDAGDAGRDALPRLPADKPRYLMGVGTPVDLIESGGARRRHVRLRACRRAPAATAWPSPGTARSTCATPARRGLPPARSGEHLPGRARLLARLPASPRQVGRVPRRHAAVVGQHGLLPGADGGHARGHRGRPLRRLGRGDPRPPRRRR